MSILGIIGELTETGRSRAGVSFNWRIPNFLSLAGGYGDGYNSPAFNCYGGNWTLTMHPKRFWQNSQIDSFSFHLFRNDSGTPITLKITFSIRGAEEVQNKMEKLQKFSLEDRACVWYSLYKSTELKTKTSLVTLGGELVLVLKIKSKEPSICRDTCTQTQESEVHEVAFEGNQCLERGEKEVLNCYHKLLAGGEDSDVLIKVQGKEFPAHRAILRARSLVFQAMFTHDMVEKQSGVVTMEDCDKESFPAFLEHVYSGSIDIISVGNVFSLFTSSDKYNLGTLKEACLKFMKSNLTASCFCDIITLAVMHSEKKLIDYATEFFSSNVSEILKTVEWQIFMKENTIVANELLIKTFAKIDKKLTLLDIEE